LQVLLVRLAKVTELRKKSVDKEKAQKWSSNNKSGKAKKKSEKKEGSENFD